MKWLVSIKPADGPGGPFLVCDDPGVIRAVLEAIAARFSPPDPPADDALDISCDDDDGLNDVVRTLRNL